MRDVTLYDSQGYQLGDQGGGQNETIRKISLHDIDFVVSFGREWVFTAYFRAYESSSSRLDQYYAVYRVPEDEVSFSEFVDAVFQRAEEHGLEIEESGAGGNVLQALGETGVPSVGHRDELRRARRLLAQRNALRFGVESYGAAFKLMSELDDARSGMSFAVTDGDGAALESLDTYDLVVEKGAYRGLTPLGTTAELMDPTPAQPESEVGTREPETWRDHPAADAAIGVVAGVAVVALVVVLYAAAVHVAWGGALGVGGGTALPMAAEVPGVNDVRIEGAGPRSFTVAGSTPAANLTLRYYDGSGNEVRNETVSAAGPNGAFNTGERSLRDNEAKVSVVRSDPTFPRLGLPFVGPPLDSWTPGGAGTDGRQANGTDSGTTSTAAERTSNGTRGASVIDTGPAVWTVPTQ